MTATVADLKNFALADPCTGAQGEAIDYVKSNLTDTLCSIIPFGSFFRKSLAGFSDKILSSDLGRKIVSGAISLWENALQFIGKFTKSPMPSLEATLTQDSDKLKAGLAEFADQAKGKDGKPLFTKDELFATMQQGVKDNISLGSTISGWSFGLFEKPSAQSIAESVYAHANRLALSKLAAELTDEQKKNIPDATYQKAAKIAESISGVKIDSVDKDKKETKFTQSIDFKDATALSYFTAIYPKEGQTQASDAANAPFKPTAPKEAGTPAVDTAKAREAARGAARSGVGSAADASEAAAGTAGAPKNPEKKTASK